MLNLRQPSCLTIKSTNNIHCQQKLSILYQLPSLKDLDDIQRVKTPAWIANFLQQSEHQYLANQSLWVNSHWQVVLFCFLSYLLKPGWSSAIRLSYSENWGIFTLMADWSFMSYVAFQYPDIIHQFFEMLQFSQTRTRLCPLTDILKQLLSQPQNSRPFTC